MDRTLIDQFEQGGEKLRAAISGLDRQSMLWKPAPEAGAGLWSIQQVVIHLLDSEVIGIDRMKRIIAEENPLLVGYNETLFAQRLSYEDQPADDAVTVVDLTRKLFAPVLRRLPDAVFSRTGIHTEVGKVTLADQIEKYVWHLDHHLEFIQKKRALLKR